MSTDNEILRKIQISRCTEVPETALHDFYGRMFPQKSHLLSRYWKWAYRIDQLPNVPPPLVAVLDGEVIAQLAHVPVTLVCDGREQTAVWGADYGVLPAYRGCGIGFRINQLWMEQHPIYLAICSPASFRIVQKQGWTPRQATYNLRLLLRPERHPRFQLGMRHVAMGLAGPGWYLLCRLLKMMRSGEGSKLLCRPLALDDLKAWSLPHSPGRSQHVVHVTREFDFMKWRLWDGPFARQYLLIQAEDTPVVAVIRMLERAGMRHLRVIALTGPILNRANLHRFFIGLFHWAFQNRIDLVRMVTADPLILEAGRHWFPIRRTLRFAYYCNKPESQEFMDAAEHRWELLDSDFDLLT